MVMVKKKSEKKRVEIEYGDGEEEISKKEERQNMVMVKKKSENIREIEYGDGEDVMVNREAEDDCGDYQGYDED